MGHVKPVDKKNSSSPSAEIRCVRVCVCVCVRMYIYIYVCMYSIYICMYKESDMRVHRQMCVFIKTQRKREEEFFNGEPM